MKFIKLTNYYNPDELFLVDVNDISAIKHTNAKAIEETTVYMKSDYFFETKETPEEILKLIERAEGQEAKAKAWDAIAPYLTQVSADDRYDCNRLYLSGGYFNLNEKNAKTIRKALGTSQMEMMLRYTRSEKKEGGK